MEGITTFMLMSLFLLCFIIVPLPYKTSYPLVAFLSSFMKPEIQNFNNMFFWYAELEVPSICIKDEPW